MSSREDLRAELEVLLGAVRSLSPDTDHYLAETFVSHLEEQPTQRVRLAGLIRNIPRRLTVLVLAVALAIGAPLAIHT